MANTLKLEIVTPEAKIYSDDVDMVTLTGVEGEMGIMPKSRAADDATVRGRNRRAKRDRTRCSSPSATALCR